MWFEALFLKVTCIVCGRTCKNGICKGCSNQLQLLPQNVCKICLSNDVIENLCQECLKRPPVFKQLFSIGIYNGLLKNLIYNYKYQEQKNYSKPLGNLLSEIIIKNKINKSIDIVTSIPLHEGKLEKRGFNQSELVAREISFHLNKKYLETIIRVKNTIPQFSLSSEEREANLSNAFDIIDQKLIKDKSILLVDDIFTTGTTIQEACKILMSNKAKDIYIATLARAIKG